VPAHLSALRRAASGTFTLGDAHDLQDVVQAGADQLQSWRLPMERLLPELPAVTLDDRQVDAVLHGQPVSGAAEFPTGTTDARVRLVDATGALVALARRVGDTAHVLHADIVLR
jgi:tRNA U55 pseudouridine synthase TruB